MLACNRNFLWISKINKCLVTHTWNPLWQEPSLGEYTLFLLRYFCYLAPLKHCAKAKELSEKVCKVLEQLPGTFFPDKTQSLFRRLWSKFKGALLTIMSLKDLVIRAWGTLLMFWCYIMLVDVVRNRLVLLLLKPVPLLIIYDVICVETLHLNNFAGFWPF